MLYLFLDEMQSKCERNGPMTVIQMEKRRQPGETASQKGRVACAIRSSDGRLRFFVVRTPRTPTPCRKAERRGRMSGNDLPPAGGLNPASRCINFRGA